MPSLLYSATWLSKSFFLNKVMEPLVGKVDGKLVEGIGSERRFWGPGRSKSPINVMKSSDYR